MDNYKDDVAHTIENALTKASTHSTIIPTIINEIENYYKQGILAYSEGISRYNVEIDTLQNLIDKELKNKQKEEDILLTLEKDVAIDARLLDRMQEDFIQKTHSIEELNTEYKEMVEDVNYKKILNRKIRELQKIQDELEELELTQLSHELERINYLHALVPKRHNIDSLREKINALTREKEHFSSTKLHQLPLLGADNTLPNISNDKDLIDTSVV